VDHPHYSLKGVSFVNKFFNVTGVCNPQKHYMVDLSERLANIKRLVDQGAYFTINRARQYGKTTTLAALERYLGSDYFVISMDFQMLSHANFENESRFVQAFSSELLIVTQKSRTIPDTIRQELLRFSTENKPSGNLGLLFMLLSKWCEISEKPIVLMIDEVDSATNNQIFLDFLAQLRGYYIHRETRPTFHSVILAGVYDVKNIKRKLRNDEEHKTNSPWNIATDFNINMSFSAEDIGGMLKEYEKDYQTGMNVESLSQLIYDYTAGYPFLVSKICKLLDEVIAGSKEFPDRTSAWTKSGVVEAIKLLLNDSNPLFESLRNKLLDYPALRKLIYEMLFNGKDIPYNTLNESIEIAKMFGFIKNERNRAVITNRIFETLLYNYFLSEEVVESKMYESALRNKNQFIRNGHLDMKLVLERFVRSFDDLYGDQTTTFVEEVGRRYFMLYLKPIINGVGNVYIESRTRNMKRTDVIVDYLGEQFVVELKIWNGVRYHEEGEAQLAEYLDYYHLKTGYMLTFNFNKKKQIGVKEIQYDDKVIFEATV
jgi:hypothetical protein